MCGLGPEMTRWSCLTVTGEPLKMTLAYMYKSHFFDLFHFLRSVIIFIAGYEGAKSPIYF